MPMQILSKRTLRLFWEKHHQAESPLKTWFMLTSKARWSNFIEVKATFNSADQVGDSRVIFDIAGNKYRLVARVSYAYGRVMVKFIGTHDEYNDINPETV
ncbi:MAG: type II toxin-antitoxin system HigB family toxin [Acidocella sp.]|nr:type II toxin-antitoxin system HigB family toxin [Acidocella sp.]